MSRELEIHGVSERLEEASASIIYLHVYESIIAGEKRVNRGFHHILSRGHLDSLLFTFERNPAGARGVKPLGKSTTLLSVLCSGPLVVTYLAIL
jgi:hypothetical protein